MFNLKIKQMMMNSAALLLGITLLSGCAPTAPATSPATSPTATTQGAATYPATGGSTTGASTTQAQADENDKLAQIKKAGKIVMGTSPDYPPNEFYILDASGNKQIVGSDVMLGQAIADKIGVKLEIKATDFQGVLSNVQAGQIDMAIAGLTYTEGRKQSMQFSTGFVNESVEGFHGLMMTKETAAKYKTLDEIKSAKLTIGAQTGSIQAEMAYTVTDAMNVKLMGVLDALALALNAGDLDAVVVSTDNAINMLATFPDFTILPEETYNLDPEGKYNQNIIGFPLGEEYQSLIAVANEVIEAAKADGTMEKWRQEALELAKKALE